MGAKGCRSHCRPGARPERCGSYQTKVAVTDVDRGIELTLSTNAGGEYVASPLRIGRYSVPVEKEGFKKAMAGPVQVNIQDRVDVNLRLEFGMVTEVVTVTGQRPQLETETSEIGQLVEQRRINALPLNGRNYAQLALLGAGVSPAEPGSRTETTQGLAPTAHVPCKTTSCSMASTTTPTLATCSTVPPM